MRCRELISVAELSAAERSAFVGAILALKTAPSRIAAAATAVTAGGGTPNRYDDYVWMHNTVSMRGHFGSAFGPWHREYLRQFEFDLRQVSGDQSIVIPYWDWTTGRLPTDPNWPFTDDLLGPLGDASGVVATGPFSTTASWRMNIRRMVVRDDNGAQTPDTNLRLRRRPATVSPGFNLPSAANARQGVAMTTPYDVSPFNEGDLLATATNAQINTWISQSFRKFLEWVLHNGVHVWIGGEDNWPSGAAPTFVAGPMSIPDVAVNDPVFWLHHCNIDRLWSAWQQRHPPGTYVPTSGANFGHNLNDPLRHFETGSAGNFNTTLLSRPADLVDSRGIDLWYTSDLPIITPVSLSVDFGDVPANLTTDWPVKFDVRTCRRVKFRIMSVAGANFSQPAGQADVNAEHHESLDPVRANVFVAFHALGAANVSQPGSVVINAYIDDTEGYYTGTVGAEFQVGSWTVGLTARPAPAPRAAVTLVLDRSGSMSESAGPNGTKESLLRSSLQVIGSILRDDDAIGIVSYDDVTATLTSPSIIQMGTVAPLGAGRQAVEAARTSADLNPRNGTAIGQGMITGAAALQTVQADANYTTKAMVVMTDGNENSGPSVTSQPVTDAIAWFSDRVYAIGLGDEANVSATTLGAISRYQLITGRITSSEQRFLLTKYFLQILARVTDTAIVADPPGDLRPGDVHRIPFYLGDSDVNFDAIVLCPLPVYLDFTLEAPDGTVIRPGVSPNVRYQLDAKDSLYRVGLPAVPGNASGTHGGLWTAILKIRDVSAGVAGVDVRRVSAALEQGDLADIAARGALPYQLLVQSYSNLTMTVELDQASYLPGATLGLTANLDEYRVPLAGEARVTVSITQPDGQEIQVPLAAVAPGRFAGAYTAPIQGVYRCLFRADGLTRGGKRFQREEVRTAAVNRRLTVGGGGTYPGAHPGAPGGGDVHQLCDLLACLLREPSVQRLVKRQKVDPREIEKCLVRYCTDSKAGHDHADAGHEHGPAIAKDDPMNEDMERLLREIALLRSELRAASPDAARRLDQLLVKAPVAGAADTAPAGGHDHHDHAAAGGQPAAVADAPPSSGQDHHDHDHAAGGGQPAAGEHGDQGHDDHHRRPLPFVLVDDSGKTSRVVMPGRDKLMGGKASGGGLAGHEGHDHGGHDHAKPAAAAKRSRTDKARPKK